MHNCQTTVCPLRNVYYNQYKLTITITIIRDTLAAYLSSQARDRIIAADAGLHHSHRNMESNPGLRHPPQVTQQYQMLDPLSEARDQTRILMDTSRIHFHCPIIELTKLTIICFVIFEFCIRECKILLAWILLPWNY